MPDLKKESDKFIKHLGTGGFFYALFRGWKYLFFLMRRKFTKEKRQNRFSGTLGKMKLSHAKGQTNIYWHDQLIIQGAGLSVAINTLGIWMDSSKADWQLLNEDGKSFEYKVTFHELPLSLSWYVEGVQEGLVHWHIGIEAEEGVHINEIRFVCLMNSVYKTWLSGYCQGYFPRLDEAWHDLCLTDDPVVFVGARASEGMAGFASCFLEEERAGLLPLIQNPSMDHDARVVGLRYVCGDEGKEFKEGNRPFFKFRIGVLADESVLEGKIERAREEAFQRALSGQAGKKKDNLNVALVNLPWQKDGLWGVRAGSRWPHIKNAMEGDYLPFPFFLAYAASLLKKNNFKVVLTDAIAQEISEEAFVATIAQNDFDILVAETSIPSFSNDMRILKRLATESLRIVLCGPCAEIYEPEFLEEYDFVDFVLCGEYERTLLELAQALAGSAREFSSIPGLIWRDGGGEVRKNPARPLSSIDLLPWPEREGLPMRKYLDAPGAMATPSAQMIASRGCPFHCSFCLWPQVMYGGNCYRPRAVQDVVDEMEYLIRKKNFKSVYFDDDTFNIGRERMIEFCNELRKRRLNKIPWAIMAKADLMDEKILKNMRGAGLYAVKYGIESAAQELIDRCGKSLDLKKAERAISATKALGIKVHLTFAFGLPGETEETIRKTIDFALRMDPYSVQFSIVTPFPGTELYKTLEERSLIVSRDFASYDGQHKSVIRSEFLSASQLELAKVHAYREWSGHIQKRQKAAEDIKKFIQSVKSGGFAYALGKVSRRIRQSGQKREGANIPALLEGERKEPCLDGALVSAPMDIMLVQCPPWDTSMPPLGVAYLAGYLKKRGYAVSVCDLNIQLYRACGENCSFLWEQKSFDWWVKEDFFQETWGRVGENAARLVGQILKTNPALCLGLSVNFAGINFARELLRKIRQENDKIKIIVGGWGTSDAHMRSLFPGELLDAFVVGEGEKVLAEVLEVFKGQREPESVRGAVFLGNGQIPFAAQESLAPLDEIPWPTFEEFPLDLYRYPILPIFTSRGCISRCSFCNDWPYCQPYRYRSSPHIFEEIKFHVSKRAAKVFSFKDLLCNGNIGELSALCDLLIESQLCISWDSQAIAHKQMTYPVLCKMKKSGCSSLIYGIESFSDNVLKRMGKIFTRDTVEQVLQDTYRAGISALINIIVGFPGETEEDFRQTLEGIARNRRYITQVGALSVCLVNGNSDLDRFPKKYGIVLPEDVKIRAKHWVSQDGKNTYALRRERAQRVIELLGKLGLTNDTATL